MKYLTILLLPCLFFIASCGDDDQLSTDISKIEDYLDEKGLAAQSTDSGLHYIIDVEGTGGHPTITDSVTVYYTGYFLDETVFDGTDTDPIKFPLGNVIEGWQEGIPLFQKGGSGTLFIPSELGYGSRFIPGIPKNSVLIFDVELVDF